MWVGRYPCLHGVNVYERVEFAVQPRLSRGRSAAADLLTKIRLKRLDSSV
jgi:hypothetical protein